MRRMGTGILIGVSLAASGCGREEAGFPESDRTGAEELATAADTSEGFRDSIAAPVVPVQGGRDTTGALPGGPITATGNLHGPADDSPRGAITLTEANGGTTVLIDITRYTAGTSLAATLAAGGCDVAGAAVARLSEPFAVGRSGLATVETRVAVPILRMLDGRHSVRVHAPGNPPPGTPLACADLPELGR